jgi:hypothetical protein
MEDNNFERTIEAAIAVYHIDDSLPDMAIRDMIIDSFGGKSCGHIV